MGGCCSAPDEGGGQSARPAKNTSTVPHANNAVTNEDIKQLAHNTHFTLNEVEALYELFKIHSNSIVKDGLIHKEEFCLALFKSQHDNLFAQRVFEVFDEKKNNVIEFGEFVRALSVFHPNAPLEEKANFAFKVYDLGNTGTIDHSEIRALLVAMLKENPALKLPESVLEKIVEQTFEVANSIVHLKEEGKLDPQEWRTFVSHSPNIISNMTLPVLRDITAAFPGFVFHSVASQLSLSDMAKSETDLTAMS